MAEQTMVAELQALFALEVKKDESQQSFAHRLVLDANEMPQDDWETLSEKTQAWVNEALEVMSKKGKDADIPLPEGIETMISGGSVETPPAPEDDVKPAKPTKVATVKKKAAAKPPEKKATKKASVAKPSKAKAPAKQKAKKAPAPRGPRGLFAITGKIKILAKENPYRAKTNSHAWFSKYKSGVTVATAIDGGIPRHHIRWDLKQGNIAIE